jgi:hypothetical protein
MVAPACDGVNMEIEGLSSIDRSGGAYIQERFLDESPRLD